MRSPEPHGPDPCVLSLEASGRRLNCLGYSDTADLGVSSGSLASPDRVAEQKPRTSVRTEGFGCRSRPNSALPANPSSASAFGQLLAVPIGCKRPSSSVRRVVSLVEVFIHHMEDHNDGESQDDTVGPAQQVRAGRGSELPA